MKCSEIMDILERLAPPECACDWDNPGLLVGRREKEVKKALAALDCTDEVIREAKETGADMIITHHPMIFRPVKSVTDGDFIGRRILELVSADISLYAMHTNFDAAPEGMGKLAADLLGLTGRMPLEPMGEIAGTPFGIGVIGELPEAMTLAGLAGRVKALFGIPAVTVFGDTGSEKTVKRAAICPGSGGSTVRYALENGAEVYISGDIGHHDGIDAVAQGLPVIDAGHFGIEHIFASFIKQYLEERIPKEITVITSGEKFPNRVI